MNTPIVYKGDYDFEIGKAITLQEGEDVAIVATGSMVAQAQKVAKFLEQEGVSSSVINMHTLKPIDRDAIATANDKHKLIVTLEEHSVIGGLYGAIAEVLCEYGKVYTYHVLRKLRINEDLLIKRS